MLKRKIILEPRDLWWEAQGVFNPGVAEYNGRTYMLYRAFGRDNLSRLGLAISEDGEHFERFDQPMLEADEHNPYERLGVEDPRITKIDKDYYITYIAASVYPADYKGMSAHSLNTPGVPWRVRVCGYRTRDFRTFEKLGVLIPNLDTKNPALFSRKIQNNYWLIHRISLAIYVSVSTNLKQFGGGYQLMQPETEWEAAKVGVACPPLETEHGWLMFYHGVDEKSVYHIGVALLDRQNPAFILKRTKTPLMSPEEPWEKKGYVNNVVFVTGVTERRGMLNLYYGGGDKVVGVAKISIDAVLESLDR
ncbi:MAG: glycosidase [Candidatus Berkelbacteria bacterium]|nr:MAG: glycosidase [Candidatus Berkelbacteria bacterium]QQG51925.1 MAG: glycosidase [Candidatus Berkelbacteria bacterium]